MFLEFFLGLRYLRAKRKQSFISIISIISILGVMMGVMALIVVLSVMNGYRADLMSKILGVNSHVLVLSYGGAFDKYPSVMDRIRKVKGVAGVTPFIYSQIMVSHAGNTSGAILRGIDPGTVGDVLSVPQMIKGTSVSALVRESGGLPTVIVGKELARQIAVHPGDTLTLVSPEGRLTPLGRVPNTRKYRIAGLFDSGMYEYDASMVYISIKEAETFLGMGGKVTGIEVKIDNIEHSDKLARDIQKSLGYPYWTKDWKQMNRSLFAALKLEKVTMFVILAMIVLVGALNIISTLVMVVMEKSKDIAILRTMGASARSIMSVFMLQGLFVGILGTVIGLGSGLGLCDLLAKYKFISLPSDVYYISTLPVQVQTGDVVLVSLAAVAISFVATLYPSWYASRINPVEALRYE